MPLLKIIKFIISNIANSIGILYIISNCGVDHERPSGTGSNAIWVE